MYQEEEDVWRNTNMRRIENNDEDDLSDHVSLSDYSFNSFRSFNSTHIIKNHLRAFINDQKEHFSFLFSPLKLHHRHPYFPLLESMEICNIEFDQEKNDHMG